MQTCSTVIEGQRFTLDLIIIKCIYKKHATHKVSDISRLP